MNCMAYTYYVTLIVKCTCAIIGHFDSLIALSSQTKHRFGYSIAEAALLKLLYYKIHQYCSYNDTQLKLTTSDFSLLILLCNVSGAIHLTGIFPLVRCL